VCGDELGIGIAAGSERRSRPENGRRPSSLRAVVRSASSAGCGEAAQRAERPGGMAGRICRRPVRHSGHLDSGHLAEAGS
jgi:hypothetical protein